MTQAAQSRKRDDILAGPQAPGLTRAGAERLHPIDMLRGLVIALMVLDHVRDFFHFNAQAFDPTDPLKTTPILFVTRWAAHLCAPTFAFLAGLSIFLQKANGKSPGDLSTYLLKRGAWLILLEVTVIGFGFNFGFPIFFLQVIFAIGASMICMSLLCRLPEQVVLALGVGLVALCPLLVPLAAAAEGPVGTALALAVATRIDPTVPLLAVYPVLPWLGIMCLGFGMGPLFRRAPAERARWLLTIAIAMIAGFVLLRGFNGYGDPVPWRQFPGAGQTTMSFLNLSKYPPSPAYVLATLGVALLLFLALEKLRGPLATLLGVFGRTPLFTYVCHIYVAHGLMLAAALAFGFPGEVATDFLLSGRPLKLGWGFSLPVVYLVWLSVLAMLYPLSRWFDGVKRRRRDWWLGYL